MPSTIAIKSILMSVTMKWQNNEKKLGKRRTVVGNLDPDVPIQAGGDDARDQSEDVTNGLPSVLADTLVRQRECVLPLIAVDK
jgi:hypothetical protein